ncbi:MAG: polyprenol phosphomannose-dependent alpha 1,6 mannosyltransferase MptB, partial [Acidimicrobiales bacterium]
SGASASIGWRWPAIGLAATLVMALTGPTLVTASDGPATRWWYSLDLPPHIAQLGNFVPFYAGMIALSIAWLALGRRLRQAPGTTPPRLWLVAVLWALPLVAGPSLFSRDVFSYAAQGTLAHVGLNPYAYGPGVLSVWGHGRLVSAVSPVWRTTVAPYGPLFVALDGVVMGAAGSHLVAAVLLLRLLELVGVVLIAYFVPRLARCLGTDPARAVWLGLLSPVVLLSLVAAGHNDALMVGLLLAGVTLALERRPLLGVVLCALATTIKVPAAAGIAFIAVAWARQQPTPPARARALLTACLTGVGVLVVVTQVSGLGWGWLSVGTLSTPGDVTVAVTPVTALGTTLASALHAVNLGPSTAGVQAVLRVIGLLAAAATGIWLLRRTRMESLALDLGLALLAVAVAGPVLWPWYLTWSFTLLAACEAGQRSRALVATLAAFGFVVSPAGSSLFSSQLAPVVSLAVVAAGVAGWRTWRQGPAARLANTRPAMPSWPIPHIPITPRDRDAPTTDEPVPGEGAARLERSAGS